ncbi:hypothetical protein Fot_21762 [Forsythia ovata]|uniref:Uncharacterized protein n=1 Tax=Forsythia ovata TaxID=205694 RepID=A0ABD1UW51_9LAMI
MNVDTAFRNSENMLKDWDHFKEWTSWLQGVLNESKKEMRLLTDERDKLKANLATIESDVAEFSKRFDLAYQAQEVTTQALVDANVQHDALIDKIAQLEETAELLQAEGYELKGENQKLRSEIDKLEGENLKLKLESVKAGVEEFRNQFEFTSNYENLQAFFVNFGARQVLTEVKELYPNLDLSTIEVDYPAPEEVEDGADPPPNDEADQHQVDGA